MSDHNRNNNNNNRQSGGEFPNSFFGVTPSMAMPLMNPNYEFLMRLSEMSTKNQQMGYNDVTQGNFMYPSRSNLSQTLSNTTNNELMNNLSWASALQYSQFLNGTGCGALNNIDANLWSPSINNDQGWKTIQSLYLDFYNPVIASQIKNDHNFQTPINPHPYPPCDSQESFSDVLAKLGHGLNAAKKREEEGLPDLIKDPILQSSIGNKNLDSSYDRGLVLSSNYDTSHSELSHEMSLSLQSSYYSKSQTEDFTRNSPTTCNRNISTNHGRGRGRPTKSSLSRSLDFKGDLSNYLNAFDKPSSISGSATSIANLSDTTSNASPSCTSAPFPKGCIFATSHVSSKLVIPPTISPIPQLKITIEGSDNESRISTFMIKKCKEEPIHKSHSKKSSSTNSIEGTIDDVLKSFQGPQTVSIKHMSSSFICSLPKTENDVTFPEDLTNGKKRNATYSYGNVKHGRSREPATLNNYFKPLKQGWTRKTYLKSISELIGDVEYESPNGQRSTSLSVIKVVLVKEKIVNLSIECFSFDVNLRLGDYFKPSFNHIMGFEKLSTKEVELIFERTQDNQESSHLIAMQEDCKKVSMDKRKNYGKSSKCFPILEKDFLNQKKEHKLIEAYISNELKKPVDDLRLMNSEPLPHFKEIPGNRLSKKSFSDCLLVSEFLYSFADVLGIDTETIPTMNDYQQAFVDRDSESIHIVSWLLTELLKFAVCDPGITNTKLITQIIGVKFCDLEVNLSTLTGVLRVFVLARATGGESEMESWLINTEYKELPGEKQSALLCFVVNEMLSSRLISCEVDKILDQQSFIRREKWISEGKLRRLKLIQNRNMCCSNGTTTSNILNGVETPVDPDFSRSAMDSDLDSVSSNENMTDSQLNWSGEDDEPSSSLSVEDVEKHIEKLNNQVAQKKLDLNYCDHRLRGIFLGQDRFYRNFYLLRHLGGIYVDSAPDSQLSNLDPDFIVEKILEENRPKIEDYTVDKLDQNTNSAPSLPQLSSEDSQIISLTPTNTVFGDMPNLNPQLEPLDLRLAAAFDSRPCDLKPDVTYEATKSRSIKLDWDLDIIDSATTLYANRAQHIYPDINFEQLKGYYRQQLEDYLRDCDPDNAMEHLKSWVSFYQMVLKNECTNVEVHNLPNKTEQYNTKNDRIKELADKELEKLGKQSVSKIHMVPNDLKVTWHWIRDESSLKSLVNSLHVRGLRERNLSKSIERHYDLILKSFKQDFSMVFNYNSQRCPTKLRVRSKRGKGRGNGHNHQALSPLSLSKSIATRMNSEDGEQNDNFISEVIALEKVEDLISTVVKASLFKKDWKYPERVMSDDTIKVIPSTSTKQFNFEMHPLDLGKDRLLELEDQLERRYLLPPLNWEFRPKLSVSIKDDHLKKTLDDVVSSSCGLEDAADSTSSFTEDYRSISPFASQPSRDSDGKDFKNSSKYDLGESIETPPGLINWRNSVVQCKNDQDLLACMSTLSSAIAWEKSIMKVLCQICRKDCNEAQLLLCDSCDQGYHTYCLRPPMTCIPDGQWFCHDCVSHATGQKLCYVCGHRKTARTMICIGCKRMLHAACMKSSMTRVPRKWTCHNCSGRGSSDELTKIVNVRNLPTLAVCLNNSVDSNSCPNSNSSITTSDMNVRCKQSSSSSISSNNILSKTRSCKRSLETHTDFSLSSKRTKRCDTDMKRYRPHVPDCTNEGTSLKDDKSSISESFDADTIKLIIGTPSLIPPNSLMTQREFDLSRHFLLDILDQEFVSPFLSPVDIKKIPFYKKVIRNPMDLCTIAGKLSEHVYSSAADFSSDLILIFTNCEQFNEDNSEVGKAGHSFRAYFYQHWSEPLPAVEAAYLL